SITLTRLGRITREVIDIVLTVPRSFLFFHGRACSQPCEGTNMSRGANTRFSVHCSADQARPRQIVASNETLALFELFTVVFYGLRSFGCKSAQFHARQREDCIP